MINQSKNIFWTVLMEIVNNTIIRNISFHLYDSNLVANDNPATIIGIMFQNLVSSEFFAGSHLPI